MDARPRLSYDNLTLRPRGGVAAWFHAPRMSLRKLLLPLVALAPTAATAASVVILEFPDAGRRGSGRAARAQVIGALGHVRDLMVIPIDVLYEAARRKRIAPRDVDQPRQLGRLCTAIGADGAVVASRAGRRLRVVVVDREGREIWNRDLDVDARGLFRGDTPRRLARAVVAALSDVAPVKSASPQGPNEFGPSRAPPEPAPDPELPLPRTAKVIEVAPTEAERPLPPSVGLTLSSPEEPPSRRGAEVAVEDLPRRTRRVADDDDFAAEAEAPPIEEARATSREAPPAYPALMSVDATATLTWRSFQFTPAPSTSGLGAVKYNTRVPYGGVELSADLFPLHGVRNLARGIGGSARYGRSLLLRTSTTDVLGNETLFGSAEEGLGAEGLWRFFAEVGTRTPDAPLAGIHWVTIRVGYGLQWFNVDTNPVIVTTSRACISAGVDGSSPLVGAMRVDARFQYLTGCTIGQTEQDTYGTPAAGGGWALRVGLSYREFLRVAPLGFGLFLNADLLGFGVSYGSADPRGSRAGGATETYVRVRGGAMASF